MQPKNIQICFVSKGPYRFNWKTPKCLQYLMLGRIGLCNFYWPLIRFPPELVSGATLRIGHIALSSKNLCILYMHLRARVSSLHLAAHVRCNSAMPHSLKRKYQEIFEHYFYSQYPSLPSHWFTTLNIFTKGSEFVKIFLYQLDENTTESWLGSIMHTTDSAVLLTPPYDSRVSIIPLSQSSRVMLTLPSQWN
jgi:hypothetical protein